MKPVSLPVPKQFPKLRATEAKRHHGSDESGKLRHINISACNFVCNFAERSRGRLDLAPRFDRVNCYVRPTTRIETKLVYCRVGNPGNFQPTRRSPLRHELLFISAS